MCKLAHYYFYIYFLLGRIERNDASLYCLSIYGHALDTLFHIGRILHADVVGSTAELTCNLEIAESVRYARIYLKSLVCRIYAEDVLRDITESPCGCTGKP